MAGGWSRFQACGRNCHKRPQTQEEVSERTPALVEADNSHNNFNRSSGSTEDLKGEVPYLRSVLTLAARPALGGTS